MFEEIDLRVAKRSVTVAGPVRNPRVEWVCQVDYAQSSDILVPDWVIRRLYDEIYAQ